MLLAARVQAQDPGPALAALRAQLQAILAPIAQRAHVGAYVESLTRGDVLFELQADRLFTPASNTKLFTAAAALDRLGPDFHFETQVRGLKRGRNDWDLTLQGGGDPVLATADLASLAKATRDAGVVRVSRPLRCDDGYFDAQRYGFGWSFGDEPFYYGAQISALTVNRNVTRVTIRPAARAGLALLVEPEPFYRGAIDVTATTAPAGSADTLSVTRRRARNEIVVAGEMPVGAAARTVSVTVEEPALLAGWIFQDELAKAGVRVAGTPERRAAPPTAIVLARHTSPPLAEILPLFNKPSDNLIGEMLLKTIGRVRRGVGSAAAGRAEVSAFLGEIGIDPGAYRLMDGSGLSRNNLVAPRAIAQLYRAMRQHRHADIFFDSLTVAGVDGTLRRRMLGTAAANNLRGKTGTLMGVCTLSGVMRTAGGEEIVLVVMTNHHTDADSSRVRAVEDRFAVTLAEFRR